MISGRREYSCRPMRGCSGWKRRRLHGLITRTSTFGNPPGSAAGRLYVIYQDFSKLKGAGTRSNGLGFFTVSEDGKTVSAHQTIHGTAKGECHGVYPTSAVTLSDGTPVALYDAGLVFQAYKWLDAL